MKKKKPGACLELTFVWSDDGQSGSSKIKRLSLRFLSRRFPEILIYFNAVVAVGSWNHFGINGWLVIEYVDFHQLFLVYNRKQVTNNYNSILAITGIILQHCMCKKLNKKLPSPVCNIHCLLHFAFKVFFLNRPRPIFDTVTLAQR